MGFIPIDLTAAKESKPVPVGMYDVIVSECELGETREKKKPQLIMTLVVEGQEDAMPFKHYVGIPGDGDTPDAQRYKVLLLARVMDLFGVPRDPKGFDPEQVAMQLTGAKARAQIGMEKETNSDGSEKADGRTFNRLIVPPLRDEQNAAGRSAPKPPKR